MSSKRQDQGKDQRSPPPGKCNIENDFDCCVQDTRCTQLTDVNHRFLATPRPISFSTASKMEEMVVAHRNVTTSTYHSDDTTVVALSTGWFNDKSRCLNKITISANGRSVVAMVVDECDSTMGCDANHDFEPPCPNNIVDASKAVWEALGVSCEDWGGLDITWSDA